MSSIRPVTAALTEIAEEVDTTPDAVTLSAVLRQPWATVVLSGAATSAGLHDVSAQASPGNRRIVF